MSKADYVRTQKQTRQLAEQRLLALHGRLRDTSSDYYEVTGCEDEDEEEDEEINPGVLGYWAAHVGFHIDEMNGFADSDEMLEGYIERAGEPDVL